VRFAARFGMTIDPATHEALVAMADELPVVAPERIAQELRRILVHPTRADAMRLLMATGLMRHIAPPVVALRGAASDAGGDLWDETLRVLDRLGASPSFPLAFAALLHAAGAPSVDTTEDGHARSPNREAAGRAIATELGRSLRLSNVERERAAWLVEKRSALVDAPGLRPSTLKRLLSHSGADELIELHRARALARGDGLDAVEFCERYLRELPQGPLQPPPVLTGHDLAEHGLKTGPLFKAILDAVREAQLDGVVHDKASALAWVDARRAEGAWVERP
jgi:poly(A) polymerase